uniref:Early nodulin 36B n=1 Tax=Phaseolus vulgaris TaxID=3885 RepID=T2DNM9_PHAVU|nr:early nodulin 36B [Phaseolus vulgaris]
MALKEEWRIVGEGPHPSHSSSSYSLLMLSLGFSNQQRVYMVTFFTEWHEAEKHSPTVREALATARQTGKSQKGNGLSLIKGSLWLCIDSIVVLLLLLLLLLLLPVECNKQRSPFFEKPATNLCCP